jgi:hypothetical protein
MAADDGATFNDNVHVAAPWRTVARVIWSPSAILTKVAIAARVEAEE